MGQPNVCFAVRAGQIPCREAWRTNNRSAQNKWAYVTRLAPTHAAPAATDSSLRRKKHRAVANPWAQTKSDPRWQVSWLAGQGLMHAFPKLSPQWLFRANPKRCIALAAHSCRDSLGLTVCRASRIPRSRLNPFRGTSAIIWDYPTAAFIEASDFLTRGCRRCRRG